MSLLKNPMILIAVLGMGMMVGLPYLMDNSKIFATEKTFQSWLTQV